MKEKVVKFTFSVDAEGKYLYFFFPVKLISRSKTYLKQANFHGSCPDGYQLGIKL